MFNKWSVSQSVSQTDTDRQTDKQTDNYYQLIYRKVRKLHSEHEFGGQSVCMQLEIYDMLLKQELDDPEARH